MTPSYDAVVCAASPGVRSDRAAEARPETISTTWFSATGQTFSASCAPERGRPYCSSLVEERIMPPQIGEVLDRLGCLRHPCDLDLLLFFSRHPRAFLVSERLAQYVGYDLPQVAQSLETLIAAGLLQRSPDSTHPARLYLLTPGSTLGEWLSSLLRFVETREGRAAVIHALKVRQSSAPPGGQSSASAGRREPEPVASVRGVPWRLKVLYA